MAKTKTRDKLLDADYEEIYKHGFQGYLTLKKYANGMFLVSKIRLNGSILYV